MCAASCMRSVMSLRAAVSAAALALLVSMPTAVTAQGITERQADEILKELRAIRQMLERQQMPQQRPAQAPAPTDDRVAIPFGSTGNSLGRADAPIVMV